MVSTAGAGDAFLAGTIAGICCGLPLFRETTGHLETAVDLGCLVASLSVMSENTIHFGVNVQSVLEYAEEKRLLLGPDFMKIFGEVLNHR